MPNYKGRGGKGSVCHWHYSGVPPQAPRRWWLPDESPNCTKCQEKLKAGLVSESDVVPDRKPGHAFRRIMTGQTEAALARRAAGWVVRMAGVVGCLLIATGALGGVLYCAAVVIGFPTGEVTFLACFAVASVTISWGAMEACR